MPLCDLDPDPPSRVLYHSSNRLLCGSLSDILAISSTYHSCYYLRPLYLLFPLLGTLLPTGLLHMVSFCSLFRSAQMSPLEHRNLMSIPTRPNPAIVGSVPLPYFLYFIVLSSIICFLVYYPSPPQECKNGDRDFLCVHQGLHHI